MKVERVEDAIKEIKQGRMVILIDDEDRENEGDLYMAAEKVTSKDIAFMATYGRGLICLAMAREMFEKLDIPLMVTENTARFGTAFGVSIDAKDGITTGISAADRTRTILAAIADDAKPADLARPGHIFPLRARDGGVLVRSGQTEGSVDLSRLSGLKPAGVICEIMKEDGTMARKPDLEEFAGKFNLKMVTIADLIAYRLQKENLVRRVSTAKINTKYGGEFTAIIYESDVDSNQHIALVKGDVNPGESALVRVHSECLTGDVFASDRCDCGEQLQKAMKIINDEGRGIIVYMRQEGRGIGLGNKIKAYALQDQGLDTVEANEFLGFKADLRDYGIGAQILRDLGLKKLKLLTNNPKKIVGLEGYGLDVEERIPITTKATSSNYRYIKTKIEKMGHLIELKKDPRSKKLEDKKTGGKNAKNS
ncbi:MAG TPA: bifunctional 3,4-dihydroxy-2-butanone-4-phosphate synthase/GTP cyclohydrolase II [bacterium]